MANMFKLDIVSAEGELFSGMVEKLFITGVMGELEILSGHAPLLTMLDPGPVWVNKNDTDEDGFVVFGGILEVQPQHSIILADSALRAHDVDEAKALSAKENAEREFIQHSKGLDYAKAHSELMWAMAQLRAVKKIRNLSKK